ncbi:hypothetical protein Dimus_021790 [Dionaea muscipula]
MMVIIDGDMLTAFIGDSIAFNKCADQRFNILDKDGDGVLQRSDLRGRYEWSMAFEYEPQSEDEEARAAKEMDDSIFERFDVDQSGTIDQEGFRQMLSELMLAVARGIGSTPVSVLVEEDSMMMKAYEHEEARVEGKLKRGSDGIGEKEEAMMKLKKQRNSKLQMELLQTVFLQE